METGGTQQARDLVGEARREEHLIQLERPTEEGLQSDRAHFLTYGLTRFVS